MDKLILENLLDIEHSKIAAQLGFIKEPIHLPESQVADSIGAMLSASRNNDNFSKKYCLAVCALLHAHIPEQFNEPFRRAAILSLSRIGVAPSTIMIEQDFSKTMSYKTEFGFFDQMEILFDQLYNQISVADHNYLLTAFQRRCWTTTGENKVTGISAPTSSGKSFILYLRICEELLNSASYVIYIVPNLSLVRQVTNDISGLLTKHGLQHIDIFNTSHKPSTNQSIYVLTQEKAIGLIAEHSETLKGKTFLIVDEVQNIEKISHDSEQRSKILYDSVKDIKDEIDPYKVILSGPRLKNIDNLGFDLFGTLSEEEETDVSPVLNLTFSVYESKSNAVFLKMYSDLLEKPRVIQVANTDKINGIGKKLYNDSFLDYLYHVSKSLGDESINIIFGPNPAQVRKIALGIATRSKTVSSIDSRVEALREYISESVHPDYPLNETLSFLTAYHSGTTPMHVRAAMEDAFRSGIVKNIVCTTTLVQGVNFPAQNIIIRSPNLFVRKPSHGEPPKLSSYDFANLRGRAGRLLRDFIGRTIILDESNFYDPDSAHEDLFEESYKEISPGYGERFNEYREEIIETLPEKESTTEDYHYLVTYIRHQLLKRGLDAAKRRFYEVGILLGDKELSKTVKMLSELSTPRSILLANRYWDPTDIERLYRRAHENESLRPPQSVWKNNFSQWLEESVNFFCSEFSFYCDRYLDSSVVNNENRRWSVSNYASQWAREQPLRKILDAPRFSKSPDNIEDAIKLIHNQVCFGIPMLLKPLVDCFEQESGIIGAIEAGCSSPTAAWLIAKGIPRDTALSIAQIAGNNIRSEDQLVRTIKSSWTRISDTLNPWAFRQIEAIEYIFS